MLFFLRSLGDHDFRREQQARDRGGVLQSQTRHLGRIQNAHFDHVALPAVSGVVAERALALADPVQDHRGIFTGIGDDLTQRLFDRAGQDLYARGLIFVLADQLLNGLERTDQSDTAARVACNASSTRAFFSFISISVAAPTLITATPPESLATRSWSFSLS